MSGGGAPSGDERLAPVTPLFGARRDAPTTEAEWRSTWAEESAAARRGPSSRHPAAVALHAASQEASEQASEHAEDPRGAAREALVRKLRTKQLTSREARDVLREFGLSADDRDLVVDEFEARGYLDDEALAEHLVTSGSQRKGQGRVAISRTLAQRGIPREIGDAALSVLDDDDAERALEYARAKVSSLRRYDEDTAIRRLVGQLSRRGYGGSVALNAARTAWRETAPGAARGRVRFEVSD